MQTEFLDFSATVTPDQSLQRSTGRFGPRGPLGSSVWPPT
jgi:hypothetical protein